MVSIYGTYNARIYYAAQILHLRKIQNLFLGAIVSDVSPEAANALNHCVTRPGKLIASEPMLLAGVRQRVQVCFP